MDTVLFICSVLLCIIGVLTFITGMTSRAKDDGVLVQKINQAIEGIEELKSDVKFITGSQQDLALMVKAHDEQIRTLFKDRTSHESTTQVLIGMLDTLKDLVETLKKEGGLTR